MNEESYNCGEPDKNRMRSIASCKECKECKLQGMQGMQYKWLIYNRITREILDLLTEKQPSSLTSLLEVVDIFWFLLINMYS